MQHNDQNVSKPRTGLIAVIVVAVAALAFGAGFGTAFLVFRGPASGTPFEQSGDVNLVAGQEGVVNFPVPFRMAPNIDLNVGGFNRTVVSEATATGFKWKNTATAKDDTFNSGRHRWTAKGLK